MFVEEDWTDITAANVEDISAVQAKPPVGKLVSVSRHCLKRTLQALGSTPDWQYINPSVGSEEEIDDATRNISKKKKQRCKKQKKTSGTGIDGETGMETKELQLPVKKQQGTKRLHKTEDCTDDKLSRRQWKNKMKNKKRCKNKFLLNSAGAAGLSLEKKTMQAEDLSVTGNMHDAESLFWRTASAVEKNNNHQSSTDASEKVQNVRKLVNKDMRQSTSLTSVCNGLRTNAHNESKNQRPLKADKRARLKAKKSQSLLNVTVGNKKLTDAKLEQEHKGLKNNPKCEMDRSTALRARMEKRLQSARFRYINELLYTSTSEEARCIFQQDPDASIIYHRGYAQQVKHWPVNPVDHIISYIRKRSSSLVIADFGCGDCKIARSVKNKVHCFDLVPVCDRVTVCDMANVPLGDATVDIVVFCLSLMGTNLTDFLVEASRVLVMGGVLQIAEVASRFDNMRQFTGALSSLGFKLSSKDIQNSHFYSFEFLKSHNAPNDVRKIRLELKPCLYKKR